MFCHKLEIRRLFSIAAVLSAPLDLRDFVTIGQHPAHQDSRQGCNPQSAVQSSKRWSVRQ
jgi:hypothetical protein